MRKIIKIIDREKFSLSVLIIAFALCYLILARLSLLLAIPPGYAMAIYPPAGLALAVILTFGYRYGIGVILGSFSLNLWITLDTQQSISFNAIILSITIGIGAMLQAYFGAWLIKRVIGKEVKLHEQKEIFLFMLLGAPIACIINASIGISVLLLLEFMPSSIALGNWITWWAGDSLGVLVFTPICLVLFGRPRQLWSERKFTVLLPQLMTMLLMIAGFIFIRTWEQDRIQTVFHNQLTSISNNFQTKLNSQKQIQREISVVVSNFPNLNKEQFTQISLPLFEQNKELSAVEWIPKITHAERASFERFQQTNPDRYDSHFYIKEIDNNGNNLPAKDRELYFPITYVTPYQSNAKALGFDVYSKENRRAIYDLAIRKGSTISTEPLLLVQEKQGKSSTLLVTAVFKSNLHLKNELTQSSRTMENVLGMVVSIFRPGDIFTNLLKEDERKEFIIKLSDIGNIDKTKDENHPSYIDTIQNQTGNYYYETIIHFGDRKWQLQAFATPLFLEKHPSWAAWTSLLAGMFFSSIVGMYCLMISGRAFQIEALIAKRTNQWQESERKRQAIVDHAADGILTINQIGIITSCNQAARTVLELNQSELIDLSLENFFSSQNGKPLRFHEIIAPLLSSSHTLLEVQRAKSDGNQIALELAIASIMDHVETIYIIVIHDLTERKRIDKIKSEFVSTVSHELRTPLTSICGSLGLLAGGAVGQLPQNAMNLIQLANTNAERLHKLINDILDFEKLEYGGMLFKIETFNLFPQIQKAITFNAGYADKFNVQLQFIGEFHEQLQVHIDEHRFIQILSNLISNAIKFSHKNGIVEIYLNIYKDRVRINIQDYGIGIDEEFNEQIFKKFTQADASGTRRYAGTGLGLSLAKNMIEKMGGEIGFTSRLGQGSIFFIELPIKNETGMS
jgi:PAS domain S-box-containing protein